MEINTEKLTTAQLKRWNDLITAYPNLFFKGTDERFVYITTVELGKLFRCLSRDVRKNISNLSKRLNNILCHDYATIGPRGGYYFAFPQDQAKYKKGGRKKGTKTDGNSPLLKIWLSIPKHS